MAALSKMTLRRLYISTYNSACAIAWTMVLGLCWQNFLNYSRDPEKLWARVEVPLKVAQTAAVLEIFHAATGLVRSSVFSTFLQVFSRIGMLWGVVNVCPASIRSPFLNLMVFRFV